MLTDLGLVVDQNLKPLAVTVYEFTAQPVVSMPGASHLWVTTPKTLWAILRVFKKKRVLLEK